MDEYGLRHLALHLYRSCRYDELYALVEDRRWYEAKCAVDFTRETFVQDVELAIECAESQGAKGLPRVVAYSLLTATVRSWAEVIPRQVLRTLVLAGNTEQAMQCAQLSGAAITQAEAYWQIGDELARQGNVETAKVALQRALSRAEYIFDDWAQSHTLSTLAQSLVRTGLVDDGCRAARMAVTVADKIDYHIPRALALAEAACALSQAGLDNEAQRVAQSGLDCFQRYECNLLKALVLLVQDALSAEHALAPIYDYSEALHKIARVFAQMGDFQRALSVADIIGIPGLPVRPLVLAEVAQRMWQVGQANEAHEVAQRALSCAKWRTLPLSSDVYLIPLIRVLAEMGGVEQACSIARPRWLARGDGTMQAKTAVALAELGHLGQACELAHRAFVTTRGDLWLRFNMWLAPALYRSEYAHNLAMVAQVLARAGEEREAEDIARQALAAAMEIENSYYRGAAFGDIALALALGGLSDQATQAARLAINASEDSPYWRTHHVLLLPGLAQALACAGEIESARVVARHLERPLYAHALTNPSRLQPHLDRALALVGVAQALAQAGDLKGALTAANRIRGLHWASQHVRALCLIGRAMVQQGRAKEASQVLRRAHSIVSRMPYLGFRRGSYLAEPTLLAEAYAEAGEIGKALNTLVVGYDGQAGDSTWRLAEIVQIVASVSSIEEARQLVQYCANMYSKVEAVEGRWTSLVAAAHAFAQLGDLDEARRLIQQALMTMDTLKSFPDQGLCWLGQTLAEVGSAERALAIAEGLATIDERDELLSGVMRALAVADDLDNAGAIARRIANPTHRADALAMFAERLYMSNSPDKLGYVQLMQNALRHARSEDRQSMARHIAALLPGLGILGRDTVIATCQHIRAAEHVVNLDMDLQAEKLFGDAKQPETFGVRPRMPTSREFRSTVFKRLYLLVGIAISWFSGYFGWMIVTDLISGLKLSNPTVEPFQSMGETAASLALIGALLYSLVIVRRHFEYRLAWDLFTALSGPHIPFFAILHPAYRLPTTLDLTLIVFTAPILCLPMSWIFNTSARGLAFFFSLIFAVHMWSLKKSGVLD